MPLIPLLPGQAVLDWERDPRINKSHVALFACKSTALATGELKFDVRFGFQQVHIGEVVVPVVYAVLKVKDDLEASFFIASADKLSLESPGLVEALTTQEELPVIIVDEKEKEVTRGAVTIDLDTCVTSHHRAATLVAQSRWSRKQFAAARAQVENRLTAERFPLRDRWDLASGDKEESGESKEEDPRGERWTGFSKTNL